MTVPDDATLFAHRSHRMLAMNPIIG